MFLGLDPWRSGWSENYLLTTSLGLFHIKMKRGWNYANFLDPDIRKWLFQNSHMQKITFMRIRNTKNGIFGTPTYNKLHFRDPYIQQVGFSRTAHTKMHFQDPTYQKIHFRDPPPYKRHFLDPLITKMAFSISLIQHFFRIDCLKNCHNLVNNGQNFDPL